MWGDVCVKFIEEIVDTADSDIKVVEHDKLQGLKDQTIPGYNRGW